MAHHLSKGDGALTRFAWIGDGAGPGVLMPASPDASGSVSRSLKSGGWNVEGTGVAAFAAGISSRLETATSHELDFKGDVLARRLRLNVAAIRLRFADFQIMTFVNVVVGGRKVLASSISNAGQVTSQGVETEITRQPLPGLTVSGAYTFNHSVYDRYTGGGGMIGCVVLDADDAQTPYAPRRKAFLGTRCERALGGARIGIQSLSALCHADRDLGACCRPIRTAARLRLYAGPRILMRKGRTHRHGMVVGEGAFIGAPKVA